MWTASVLLSLRCSNRFQANWRYAGVYDVYDVVTLPSRVGLSEALFPRVITGRLFEMSHVLLSVHMIKPALILNNFICA